MKNLLKYEFRKTLFTKLIILGITAIAQIVFLCGIWADSDNTIVIGALLLYFTAFGGIIFIGLQSVITLHRDMNTKQSYMLFMTPNSCYKILGAKTMENFISMVLSGAFFFGLGVLDVAIMLDHYGELKSFMEQLSGLLEFFGVDLGLDAGFFASMAFGLITGWFATITAAFLADVVSSALLNGKKFNFLLSFILFIALSYLMSFVTGKLSGDVIIETTATATTLGYDAELIATKTPNGSYFLWSGLISLVFAGIWYIATAELMSRKLSV